MDCGFHVACAKLKLELSLSLLFFFSLSPFLSSSLCLARARAHSPARTPTDARALEHARPHGFSCVSARTRRNSMFNVERTAHVLG